MAFRHRDLAGYVVQRLVVAVNEATSPCALQQALQFFGVGLLRFLREFALKLGNSRSQKLRVILLLRLDRG
ncbi:MAG: hypothetical protein M3436_00695 [Pseudomonadota bacterium]|nr:hypothetical protein [Pseudomonadota bacterium]